MMRLILATVAVSVCALTALGDLPGPRTLSVKVRETPSDPESAVIYVLHLRLVADSQDGDSIGWEVDKVTVDEMDGASVEETWVDNGPDVDSADGLWWVEHADPEEPTLAEFADSPEISGTALTTSPGGSDLDYTFDGIENDNAIFSPGLDATMWLKRKSSQTPEVDQDDEPMEWTEFLEI